MSCCAYPSCCAYARKGEATCQAHDPKVLLGLVERRRRRVLESERRVFRLAKSLEGTSEEEFRDVAKTLRGAIDYYLREIEQ